jgi:hypothetical protein
MSNLTFLQASIIYSTLRVVRVSNVCFKGCLSVKYLMPPHWHCVLDTRMFKNGNIWHCVLDTRMFKNGNIHNGKLMTSLFLEFKEVGGF